MALGMLLSKNLVTIVCVWLLEDAALFGVHYWKIPHFLD